MHVSLLSRSAVLLFSDVWCLAFPIFRSTSAVAPTHVSPPYPSRLSSFSLLSVRRAPSGLRLSDRKKPLRVSRSYDRIRRAFAHTKAHRYTLSGRDVARRLPNDLDTLLSAPLPPFPFRSPPLGPYPRRSSECCGTAFGIGSTCHFRYQHLPIRWAVEFILHSTQQHVHVRSQALPAQALFVVEMYRSD